jgi:hypothetical protein
MTTSEKAKKLPGSKLHQFAEKYFEQPGFLTLLPNESGSVSSPPICSLEHPSFLPALRF